MFTAVIATIGRPTLESAVESFVAQGVPVIVVSDGFELRDRIVKLKSPLVQYVELGRNWGRQGDTVYYGQIGWAVGLYMAATEFGMIVGDDDELVPGSAKLICDKIVEHPEIDMWIPGLHYNEGDYKCMHPGFECGNVSHPCYRTELLARVPIHHADVDQHISDFHHMERVVKAGYKVGWVGAACIEIRPRLPGRNGRGN